MSSGSQSSGSQSSGSQSSGSQSHANSELIAPQGSSGLRERLRSLELMPDEVHHLCGCDPSEVWRSSLLRDRRSWIMFWLQEMVLAIALTPILAGGFYIFVLRPLVGDGQAANHALLWLLLLCLLTVPLAIVAGRWVWRVRSTPIALAALLDDLDRYHGALKAVTIADELARARHQAIDPEEQTAVILALELTRDDLIRAFSTERILRENQEFLAVDLASFGESLTAIQAIQTEVTAREYQEILQRTVTIGASVREEMRKLQH